VVIRERAQNEDVNESHRMGAGEKAGLARVKMRGTHEGIAGENDRKRAIFAPGARMNKAHLPTGARIRRPHPAWRAENEGGPLGENEITQA
jgi:hypothetical protein